MKRIVVILICFIPLLGCDLIFGNGENFPPEPDIEHYTIIFNNSIHKIEFKPFYQGEVFHVYNLYDGGVWKIHNEIFEEDIPFFLSWGDSVNVVYDDTLSIWHFKKEIQDVARSVMLPSSYTGGKVNDKLYEIYYTFTDADYEEAVRINEGG